MRKIFTLLAAMVCSFASFAQDIQLETKDGQVIENGSTVTIQGEMLDMMIYGQFESNLYVRNLTESNQGVYAEMKAVTGNSQICWGGSCVPIAEGGSYTTGMGVVGAGSSTSLLIESLIMTSGYMDATVACTIEITVWTDKKPEEKVSATVTFTNDPVVLNIEGPKVKAHAVYVKDNVLYYNFPNVADRQLQIYNVAGNICQNVRLTSEAGEICLEGMSKGLYLYRVVEGGNKGAGGKLLVK